MSACCAERQSSQPRAPCESPQATQTFRVCRLRSGVMESSQSAKLLQDHNVQPVWAMYSAHQRTHICRGARTGDENEVAAQCLAVKAVRLEQVHRTLHDHVGSENGDVQTRKKADGANIVVIDRDTDRTGARDRGERVGNANVARCKFRLRSLQGHAGESPNSGKQVSGKIEWLGDRDLALCDATDSSGQVSR